MPVFENTKSKIKMVILTQNKHRNKVWWSPINQNKRKSELVIRSMLKRFERSPLYGITNVVQFYENNLLISQFKFKYENSLKENQNSGH
ncbi:hypothetical protein [Flavobacterium sp. H122]|uniref:hypothetical protein n=1 Tax=Flavobacterium sp. H122 TaxID=2529860 RepID=UPI0010AA606C|nr:hypothetical protein [Flavobacterium sp. H122]